MASNVVSQNSTNQPGNIVTPAAQNQTQAMVVQLPSGQTQITAPNTAAAQEAARAQLAAEQQQILHSGPVAQQAAPPVQTPSVAAQAPGQIQNVANLGQPAQQAPGYTVTTAQTSIPEVRPTTSQGVQSNSVPQTQDYAASLPQTNTTPSGQTASAQDRVNAVLNLSRQGITDPAQLQQYLNVTQAGSLPTNYTTQEIQQILNSNPQARPTQTAVASNAIQSSIQALQAIANTTPRTIANTNTLANLQNALTEANNGVVTSDLATNISNIIGSIVSNYQTLTLPQLPDYGAQLTAAQNEAQRLGAMVDDPSIDPAMQQMIALQAEQARNHISQIEDIQTRSQQQYDDQVQANKEADARAQVAMAGARLTGSPVAASYLASVAIQGRRALTEITTAQNRAINEAEAAYRKDNIELALKKIDLAEKRRSQYFDLLDKQIQVEQNLYQAQTDRVKLQSDLQDKYLERQRQAKADARADVEYAKKTAQESYGEFLKANLDPSVVPEAAYQDYATANNITLNAAKAIYKGQSADLAAAKAQEKAKNAAEIDKARLSLIKAEQDVAYNLNPGEKVTYTSADGTTKTITGAFNVRDAKQYSVETPRGKEVVTVDPAGNEIGRIVLGANYVSPQYDNDTHQWVAYNPSQNSEDTIFDNGPYDEGTKAYTVGKDIVSNFSKMFGVPTQEPGGSFTHGNTMAWDYSVRANTPIQSPINGVVVAARNGVTQNYKHPEDGNVDFGNYVEILDQDTGMRVRMAHFGDMPLQPGQRISAGDLIGRSGNTGLSTNPHLHLEFLTSDGKAISPNHQAKAQKIPVLGGDVSGQVQAGNVQAPTEDPFTAYEKAFGVTLNRSSSKDKARALDYAEEQKKKASGATLTDAQRLAIQKSPVNQAITAGKDTLQLLKEYEDKIREVGFESYGVNKAVMDRIYADLKVKYKDTAGLGALTGPDVALLEEAIKPASGGPKQYAQYFLAGGKDGAIAGIESLRKSLETRLQRGYENLQEQYPDSQNDPFMMKIGQGIVSEKTDQSSQKLTPAAQISEKLKADPGLVEKVSAARKAGYSDEEILSRIAR